MQLNLQVVPYRLPEHPEGAKLVMLPVAKGEEAVASECANCGGKGTLPRGDRCQKCAGSGRGNFVPALRWDISEADQEAVSDLLAKLPSGTRRQLTIRLEESGGGSTNTGSARIVAGLKGEKLPAVYGHSVCNGSHAVFYVHAALVVSYSQHRGQGSGSVSLIGIGKDHKIETVELWRFTDGEDAIEVVNHPATSLEFPLEAVAAAKSKARCYHCRSAFYAAEKGASGPNGALTGAGAAYGGMPSPFKGPGIGY